MQELAADHAVYAFDIAGFGESERLAEEGVEIEDLAVALRDALDAVGLHRVRVFGTHTGACVALELARRFPERTTGVVLDGVPIFDHDIARDILANYMPPFVPLSDGSHLTALWSRTRDQALWFPWYRRTAGGRADRAFPNPEQLHASLMDFFRSEDVKRHANGAAFRYDVRSAVTELGVPATFMARSDDRLFPHLSQLPELRKNQQIQRHGSDRARYQQEVARQIRALPPAETRITTQALSLGSSVQRRSYVTSQDLEILVRQEGASTRRPILLIHDARWSSQMFEPLLAALAEHRPVIALDLPGNGDSDGFATGTTTVRRLASAARDVIAQIGVDDLDVYGRQFGSAVAVELACLLSKKVRNLHLDGALALDRTTATLLRRSFAPPIELTWDGAYLYRTWLMLRDEWIFWPWFVRDNGARRVVEEDFSGAWLHKRLVEVLKSKDTYAAYPKAALHYDIEKGLQAVKVKVSLTHAKGDIPPAHEFVRRLAATYSVVSRPQSGVLGLFHALQN